MGPCCTGPPHRTGGDERTARIAVPARRRQPPSAGHVPQGGCSVGEDPHVNDAPVPNPPYMSESGTNRLLHSVGQQGMASERALIAQVAVERTMRGDPR